MNSTRKTVVVVGHGMVGHRFVEALRSRDEAGQWQVIILSEEKLPAYDRVGLSYYVGNWNADDLALPGNMYDGDELVDLRLGQRGEAIDLEAKTVTSTTGDVIAYDALVMATGSYPFVPPVPGHDLPECFVYRTIDDLDGIRAAAEAAGPGAHGVVVGGGLLGLEAANALRLLGMTPHVIEYNGRLMPAQVDAGGGAILEKLVTDIGLNVHTGVGTAKIVSIEEEGADNVTVHLSDDAEIRASLVVFSAGVRPQDALAKASGLETGARGGILTDLTLQTSDPSVYAIGECAAIEGVCYGLVAPGYTTAEIVADRLLGGAGEFPGADMSTKLKLMGVDVASFGDAHGTTEGALEVVLHDAAKGTYAKLVVS
ncbi:NAD(P)/FAD-dependent oxidoreductase, partial [Nocardia salmonicida]